MWPIICILCVWRHESQLELIYTCKCVSRPDHESLWKTLCDRVKVIVGAGMDGWSLGSKRVLTVRSVSGPDKSSVCYVLGMTMLLNWMGSCQFHVHSTFRNVFTKKCGDMFNAYFTCCICIYHLSCIYLLWREGIFPKRGNVEVTPGVPAKVIYSSLFQFNKRWSWVKIFFFFIHLQGFLGFSGKVCVVSWNGSWITCSPLCSFTIWPRRVNSSLLPRLLCHKYLYLHFLIRLFIGSVCIQLSTQVELSSFGVNMTINEWSNDRSL